MHISILFKYEEIYFTKLKCRLQLSKRGKGGVVFNAYCLSLRKGQFVVAWRWSDKGHTVLYIEENKSFCCGKITLDFCDLNYFLRLVSSWTYKIKYLDKQNVKVRVKFKMIKNNEIIK